MRYIRSRKLMSLKMIIMMVLFLNGFVVTGLDGYYHILGIFWILRVLGIDFGFLF